MAYIGNTVENQGFTPAIDYFNGNGVTVTFTLSRPVASVAQVIVAIDNVIQNPSSSFTVAGNAITFSSAPLSGTNNIWVEYTSLITTYQAISQDPTVVGDIRATGGYLAEGDFGNSFVDGAILDYVTGLGRITVGDLDGLTIYNGGTAARTALMTVGATGNVGIGTSSPQTRLHTFSSATTTTVSIQGSLSSGANTPTLDFTGNNGGYSFGARIQAIRNTGAGGYALAFGTTTNNAAEGSAPTERMRIDSSGRVTAPYQPAFKVVMNYGGGNQGVTQQIIPFNYAFLNTGSHFNLSTYTFTAPIAGTYMLSFGGMNSQGNTGATLFRLFINGVQISYTHIINSHPSNTSNTFAQYMNAGDTAYVDGSNYHYGNGPAGFDYPYFSGYLLG